MNFEYLSSFYDNTIELIRVMLERYEASELQAIQEGKSTANLLPMKEFIGHRYVLKTRIEI